MSQDSPKRRILAFLGEWVVEVGTRLYGEHPLHTFIWETVQKNFFNPPHAIVGEATDSCACALAYCTPQISGYEL